MPEVIMPKAGDAMTEGKVIKWYKQPGDAVKKGEPVAEIAYRVQRACLDQLDAPVERVTSEDVPMPYARNLELEVMPQVDDVVAAVRRALYLD